MKRFTCWVLGHKPILYYAKNTWRDASGNLRDGYTSSCVRCGEEDKPYPTNLLQRTVLFWISRTRNQISALKWRLRRKRMNASLEERLRNYRYEDN